MRGLTPAWGWVTHIYQKNVNITESLIEKCRKGHTPSQVELYRLCYPALMPVCRRYVRDSNEAAAQLNTAFYRVLKSLSTYEFTGRGAFLAWSRRIVINSLIDHYRRQRTFRDQHVSIEHSSLNGMPKSTVLNEAALQLDAEHILRMLDELPFRQKTVFQLHAIDAFSHKEISEKLEISEGTSRWYLSEARKAMQKKLHDFSKRLKTQST